MIEVKIFRNENSDIYGFKLSGHAGYAEEGNDIVCSATTMLVINTINCIELFTDEKFICNADEVNGGFIDYILPNIKSGKKSHDSQLLIKTMLNGLNDIKEQYSKYINILDREV